MTRRILGRDGVPRAQLATAAAVSEAFRTPEILRLFALKQPAQLRDRLAGLDRDKKLGKMDAAAYATEAVEILTALKKLGGELSAEEAGFLRDHMTSGLASFEKVVDEE